MSVGSIGGTYGLSGSGMDIDALVKKLMTGQQAKSDALLQKKTVAQWQKSAYNTVYDDISNFRATAFNYKLQGTLNPNKVSCSNTSVVTATANAGAADVNHSLVVAQLASGVNLTSAEKITTGTDKLTLASQMGVQNSFSLNIGDGSANKSITISPSDSINDVVSAINSVGLNVQANYDSTLDRFFIATTNMGSATGISITTTSINTAGTDDGGNFIKGLHLFPTGAPSGNNGGTVSSLPTLPDVDGNITNSTTFTSPTGLDAEFKLDGVQLTQASNTFSISSVTYSLTGVSSGTTMNDDPGLIVWGPATSVSVTNDTDAAVASIQSLVDSYNKILAQVNGKVNETRYKDYLPLADAQKAAMKDSDITAWEAKAKSGMLHNDPTLTSLVNTMRNAFSSPVTSITSTYKSASTIAITTGNYTEGGKLYLDTDKLRTAINADPNVLSQLFGTSGTTNSDGTIDFNSQGIAGRLYDGIKNTMDQLVQKAGTTSNAQYDTNSDYAKRITAYTTQINKEADRFDTIQAAYYKQYNAMETALSSLNSQSSWLSSMLGTSSSS